MPPDDTTSAPPLGPVSEPPAGNGLGWDPDEGHPRRNLVLITMCASLVLIVAAVSSLNVAIPTIVRELDPTSSQQLWIIDAYALVFAGLLLLCGALGDRYGRKHALLIGLAIFAAASTAAAYSGDPNELIAYRAVMGIGAALIMPATLSTLTVVFSPRDRAKAIAVWAGFAGAGGAIGPLASGLLLEQFWWGSVFFVAVPIALVALFAVAAIVPNSADSARHRLDYLGATLSVVALTTIVFGIIEGPEIGWLDPITLGSFAIGIATSVAYVLWERSVDNPLLDPRYFLIPRFGLGSLTISAAFLTMFGMFYLVTLYLQFVLGYSALETAVRLLPFPLVMILVAPQSPRFTARFGTGRIVATGFVIQAIGFGLAASLDAGSSYAHLLLAVLPMALGGALLMPPTTNAIVTALPPHKAGVASAVNDTTREVGGAVGIAMLGTLVTVAYQSSMEDATGQLPVEAAEAARDSIGGAMQVATQLDPSTAGPLVQSAQDAFTTGTALAFGVASGIGLVLAMVIARFYPSDEVDDGGAPEPAVPTEARA